MSGEADYDRFVAHLQRHRPGVPVPSRREFERHRMAGRDNNPSARCC